MKTLKDYINLLEGNEPSAGLRAVGVTPSDIEDAVGVSEPQAPEQLPPLVISKSYISTGNETMPDHNISVAPTMGSDDDKNEQLLRDALKAGGVPMPDETPDIANTTGININITDGQFSASGWGEDADRLLKILQDAGLADEKGNAIVPQQEQDDQEEVTEASDEAVERVVALSKELNKR